MTDELVNTNQTQEPAATGRDVKTFEGENFLNKMWGIDAPAKETVQTTQPEVRPETPAIHETKPEVVEPKTEEHPLIKNDWYKDLGWESEDAAKNEVAELKKLKDKKPEVVYGIEPGKEDEMFELLSKKKQLAKAANLDLTKPEDAATLIKLNLKLKHDALEGDEIADLFAENYSKPYKPKQSLEQTDEEYAEVVNDWQQKCDAIDRKIIRDAKMAKPEVDEYSKKIVIPEIPKQDNQAKAPTQEELDKAKRYDESYIQSVDNSLKEFNGFSVAVKNEAVGLSEISVAFGVMDAEKTSLAQELKDFSKANYDTNVLFAPRWVNEDGTLNAKQIAEDRYLLANRDKIFQKMTNDAATKAIETYIKGKKQINVTETTNTGTVALQDEKTEADKMRDFFYS